jgi:hypothetical protein
MLRKIKLFTIIAAILLLMAGCDLNKKIEQSITEGILETAIGEEADVEINGEDISFTGEDGEEVTFDEEEGLTIEGEDGSVMSSGGEYEWPEGQAADYLPKFDGGKITYILNSDDSCTLMIEEMETKDYENYLEVIMEEGYNVDKVESSAEDMLLYSAQSEKGATFTVYFAKSERVLTISVDISGISN